MNKVYKDISGADLAKYREQGCGFYEAKHLVMADRMISAVVQSHVYIENDELKKAVELQNDIIMTLITETRGKR